MAAHFDPPPPDDYICHLHSLIARHRFAVMAIGYGGCDQPGCCGPQSPEPWMYTIGLTLHGLPELVLVGLDQLAGHRLVNRMAQLMLAGQAPPTDARAKLNGRLVKLANVPDDWLGTDPERMALWFEALVFHGTLAGVPLVQQLVWADAFGRFPGEPGCDAAVGREQPLLSTPPFSHPRQEPEIVSTRHPSHHRRRSA